MGLVLLDSSFLIALFTQKDIHHQSAVEADSGQSKLIASTITLSEVMAGAFSAKIDTLVEPLLARTISEFIAVDQAIARESGRIRAESGLKLPDAIICATARLHKAELWTFDAKLAKATPGARLLA
jgi:predicted nucleic acid-binding protein